MANHSSHLDTPTILRALPRKWRRRTAVAAAADYFYRSRWKARGVALLFNTVPLGRKGGGLSNGATDHVDRLIDDGWNLVMFPEGTRSRDGEIGKVRSGAAVIAANHDVDIVPIYLSGTHEAMPPGQNWPRRIPAASSHGATRSRCASASRSGPGASSTGTRSWTRCARSGSARASPASPTPVPSPGRPMACEACSSPSAARRQLAGRSTSGAA